MLLTRLEIKGFKSFGDKVTLHFDRGVTGIVGQNGCGKSNIVDAIRWVLGEQKTKALRSDKMENIIFNGTNKRKPLQMAEVSLTFQNTRNLLPTEYTEVTITRRLYRSGESEYLLNGVPCRLKDINNLFIDTGVGPDSYAIIELKMIDEILNDKENARRNLFEEAAGIAKFKVRKRETLRKLDDTQQNLDRVEDLLFEIEKNLKALERQAKKTARYYELKEEYKQASIQLALYRTAMQRQQRSRLEKQIQQENDRLESITVQILKEESKLEEQKNEILQQERLLASRQKSLNEKVSEIRQYENEKKLKLERAKFLQEKTNSLEEQLEQDQEREQELNKDIQVLHKAYTSAQQEYQEQSIHFEELKQRFEQEEQAMHAIQKKLHEQQQLYQDQIDAFRQLEKQIEIKQTQCASIKQALERYWQSQTQQQTEIEEIEAKLLEARQQLEAIQQKIHQQQALEQEQIEQIRRAEKENETIQQGLQQAYRQRDARLHEIRLLQALIDNLEGYPEAIRYLRKSGKWHSQAPLFSEIIACHEAYKIAIERYLEAYLGYFVVEDMSEALEAIILLDSAQKGKASFFVSKHIHASAQPNLTAPLPGAIPALSVVEYDRQYTQLVHLLLGNVFIVDKLPDTPPCEGIVLVSKDGKYTQTSCVLTGGSVGQLEGKRIGKLKELERLQQDFQQLEAFITEQELVYQQKQADLQALRQVDFRHTIQSLQKELSLAQQQYISLQTKKEQQTKALTRQDEQMAEMQEQLQELTEYIRQYQPQLQLLAEQKQQTEQQLSALRQQAEQASIHFSEVREQFNSLKLKLTQQKSRLDSLQQEISFKTSYLQNTQVRAKKIREELAQLQQESQQYQAQQSSQEDKLVEMYEEKQRIEKAVNEAERAYYQQRAAIEEAEKQLREIRRQKDNQLQLLAELEKVRNEIELQYMSQKERIAVEFNVELEALPSPTEAELASTLQQESELANRVATLKEKLDTFGPINPMAIESYQEIKARYDFIQEQRQDLLDAKKSLMETIQETEEVARHQFLQTFEQIRQNFQRVFRSLFVEEDTCDLILTDPENPLECNIEIIAKPKGKRPLTINQLSGGEKTLTATSLLFAIYLVKPAPFCVFDEVDAPLDDANIDKFTRIIREFSKDSQFIIVTHNKRTMAATDTMYGVTMLPEDPGVSKLVAVDLRETIV